MKKPHICMHFVFKGFRQKFPLKKIFKIISLSYSICFGPDRASRRKYAIWKKYRCEKSDHVNLYYFRCVVCACRFSRYILITDPYCNCKWIAVAQCYSMFNTATAPLPPISIGQHGSWVPAGWWICLWNQNKSFLWFIFCHR